jgi:hypothetical protein
VDQKQKAATEQAAAPPVVEVNGSPKDQPKCRVQAARSRSDW